MILCEALQQARASIAPAEARLLLCHCLGCDPAWLAAHGDETLEAGKSAAFAALAERRRMGEPIAYILGWKEFHGRRFAVSPAVLIPRPETELLVEAGLAAANRMIRPRILDLGTGSGCVAITLALELDSAELSAIDASPDALALARENAGRLGAAVSFHESDWFAGLSGQHFDVVVANPPYVAAADPHLQQGDLRFEPSAALASGADGLDAIRRIVADAPARLNPGGCLIFEHGYDQGPAAGALLAAAGFGRIQQLRDLAGIVRISGGHIL